MLIVIMDIYYTKLYKKKVKYYYYKKGVLNDIK